MSRVELDMEGEATARTSDEGHVRNLLGRSETNRCRALTKENLKAIFVAEDSHEQFKHFVSHLWATSSATMTTPVRIIAEYDFHNVIFCREQGFTAEQTIAFRGITLSVFETAIVNGELGLAEAFEAFTHQVLALAEGEEAGTNATAATVVTTGNRSSGQPQPTNGVSAAAYDGGAGSSGDAIGASDFASATGDGGVSGRTCHDGGDGGRAVFSVGGVDAITRFVARGLYRNFALYRMCFQHDEKCCREIRHVQVETPLDLLPLHEAAGPGA